MEAATVQAGETSTALFSLQVVVDAVRVHAPRRAAPGECLLAFQLLQFDIVLFDDSALVSAVSHDDATQQQQLQLRVPQGQSCLFECNPQRLSQDIRDDENAALVLLLLQREDQKARLEAFACVRLELPHIAFSQETKRPRVSEWVAVDATWPLVNHQNHSVGSVSGSVTLACLGRVLAPHLMTQRFGGGMHVMGKPRSPKAASSTCNSVDEAVLQAKEVSGSGGGPQETQDSTGLGTSTLQGSDQESSGGTRTARTQEAVPSPRATSINQSRDAAVQCTVSEEEDEGDDVVSMGKSPNPILVYGRTRDGTSRSTGVRVVDELDRLKMGSRSSSSPSQPRISLNYSPRHTYISYARGTSRKRGEDGPAIAQFPELPPPLFFHNPRQQQR